MKTNCINCGGPIQGHSISDLERCASERQRMIRIGLEQLQEVQRRKQLEYALSDDHGR